MIVLSYNLGHDGAFACLENGRLVTSIEAEKNSHYRHSAVSVPDVFRVLSGLKEVPDVLCVGGWWPHDTHLSEQRDRAGYHGVRNSDIVVGKRRLLGKTVEYFSSSHERSHLLCAFGMSNLPKGAPCYALLWEGVIGSFYEIDSELNVTRLADVMPEPGHRYALLYGLVEAVFRESRMARPVTTDTGGITAAGVVAALRVP